MTQIPKEEIKQKAKELYFNFTNESYQPIKIYGLVSLVFNFKIREYPMSYCSATFTYKNGTGIISLNSNEKYEGRKRFAIAHEIGHYLLHYQNQSIMKKCNENDFTDWLLKGRNIEYEANYFASELLLPTKYVEEKCKNSLDFNIIKNLANIFQTSLIATAYKCIEVLEYIPCIIIFSQDNKIKWYKMSEDLRHHEDKFFISKKMELNIGSQAYNFFNKKNIIEDTTTAPSVWFTNQYKDEQYFLEEYTFIMPNLNATLTLLLLKEIG
jgi:Zn-dependent peptidase ImmA (M78 family)